MRQFWRLHAICHEDDNDTTEIGYIETRNNATLEDVLKYIVKNHKTLNLFLEPLYSNLESEMGDDSKMTVENIKKVMNNCCYGYEILIEKFCPIFIDC